MRSTGRTIRYLSLVGIVSFLLVFFLAEAFADTVYVEVKNTKLRKDPKAWSPALLQLNYGEPLETVSADGGWVKVRSARGKEGYVHLSALSRSKIVLKTSQTGLDKRADESDVVLAGKGFSKEVEGSYARNNHSLNYAAVNDMERLRVSDGELAEFLKKGKLNS